MEQSTLDVCDGTSFVFSNTKEMNYIKTQFASLHFLRDGSLTYDSIEYDFNKEKKSIMAQLEPGQSPCHSPSINSFPLITFNDEEINQIMVMEINQICTISNQTSIVVEEEKKFKSRNVIK